jgi:chromate transport protein ChrA
MQTSSLREYWPDTATQLLKIGATAYGGPAIMGVMQAELQEKRRLVSKERFVEGLSLVNMRTRAALRGISPAVIGVPAVSLVRLAPHAVPDLFALVTLAATVVVLMRWRVAAIKVMLGGAMLGIARSRLLSLPMRSSLLSAVMHS